jgi:outer membrane biosynthesis protein TonB
VSGLELCPKCKKGHLYPVVTASASTEPKAQFKETGSIRDYECAICGYKQKAAKQTQNVDVKDKVSASVKKTKKPKPKPKPKTKPKPKPKPKTKRKRTKQR